jgi:hypothetical protein
MCGPLFLIYEILYFGELDRAVPAPTEAAKFDAGMRSRASYETRESSYASWAYLVNTQGRYIHL